MKITDYPKWITWKGATKKPIGSINKVNLTLQKAMNQVNQGVADGVGIILEPLFVGIDIDKCIVNDEIEPWAQEIIDKFKETYIEMSPSGKGIHIICMAELPWNGKRKNKLEMYSRGRYLTVSFLSINNKEITTQQLAVNWLVERTWPTKQDMNTSSKQHSGNIQSSLTYGKDRI